MEYRAKRNLFPVGNSLAITIPSQWIQIHNLKKGNIVKVVPKNGYLVIKLIKNKKGGNHG